MTTQVFAIVGPSGAGKDTLIAGALKARPDIRLVRRVITRPTDAGGEEYEGVSETVFATRAARGDFALTWEAHGLHYGIPRSEVDHPGTVVFNGSRAALPAAQQAFPDLQVILVTAPTDILAHRLAARGRETEAQIRDRLDRAEFELPEGVLATTVLNEGPVEAGVERLLAALQPVRA
ncbi:MAG: phosphonate metabolism protein/1,5-bisphosphokinase (PRPP-forming) PhnN [Rhodobacterales bacterium 32-66-7]|nr:MAG: phosphonate metabolism protein/1,5-bisphosphokinase (PRPP-forming) PhnN [Rhodobacterales bacterium 12-65-15]OYX23568.1 MAG: phosphonate metabolism protein/1,5-bisphosphokinase (PRPP-forming) PhnN [Rhodobacterales bacterium 32-66-7]